MNSEAARGRPTKHFQGSEERWTLHTRQDNMKHESSPVFTRNLNTVPGRYYYENMKTQETTY